MNLPNEDFYENDFEQRGGKSKPFAEKLDEDAEEVISQVGNEITGPEVPPKANPHDFNEDVPREYWNAEVGTVFLEKVREARAHAGRSLLLTGSTGSGKTHQLWGLYRRIEKNISGFKQRTTNICDGRSYVVGSMKIISEAEDIESHRYERPYIESLIGWDGWLAVDDIGFARTASEWAIIAIYQIANGRRRAMRPTIWTSNLTPDKLKEYYTGAIHSRLTGGVVLQVDGEDRRQ